MRQTDLRQTGVAIVGTYDGRDIQVPLFSSNLLEEAFKLMETHACHKVKSIFAFSTIRELKQLSKGKIRGQIKPFIELPHIGGSMKYFI